MDTAMVRAAADRGHKFDRECKVLAAGLLLILLVLSRYIVNGRNELAAGLLCAALCAL